MQENVVNPVQMPQQAGHKKGSKTTIIIFAILAFIAVLAVTAYTAYTYGKNQGKEESKISSNDTQQTDNDKTSDNQTTSSTTTTTISESTDLYEGWNTYIDQDNRVSFKYPSDWVLNESEYNPLSYTISVTGESGYSISFISSEGSYGEYCIFSDTDTSNMPENYINGLMDKKNILLMRNLATMVINIDYLLQAIWNMKISFAYMMKIFLSMYHIYQV